MRKRDLIRLRQGLSSDKPFIFSSWLLGLRYSVEWFRAIDQNIYFKSYHKIIEKILDRPTANILIACLVEDDDTILGFSVSETPDILHWVYVKPAWRGIHLMKDLVPHETKVISHITPIGQRMKPREVAFNPFV